VRTVYRSDADNWNPHGPKINSEENLAAIHRVIEESGAVIVEHRHYRGAGAPTGLVFDDFEKFEEWLEGTNAGDSISVWDYWALCRDDNALCHGKCPDERGEVPERGAY
jgi:hypothetical protein